MSVIFEILARRMGEAPEEVRAEIERTIDLVWADRANREKIIRLSGNFSKPTPEEFITLLANEIR